MIDSFDPSYPLFKNLALFAGINPYKEFKNLPERMVNPKFDSEFCGVCGICSDDSLISSSEKFAIALYSYHQQLFYAKYSSRLEEVRILLREIDSCINEDINIEKINEILERENFLGLNKILLINKKKIEFGKID